MRKQYIHIVLILLFTCSLSVGLQARHIIGGVMTYECQGNNSYQFLLKVYRDCNCSNCAELDPAASIAVYKCSSLGNCPGQFQSSPYATFNFSLSDVTFVEEPDYPCLIPPDVCVQEGTYQFSITLPASTTESYFIAYQRCCRNETINNLIAPDDTGATYMIELTPEAQAVCNSSPVFNDFPPTIICNNLPLTFDHSATDPDGDVLVYEFCTPLSGGGPLLDPVFYNTCEGAYPTPACPPPYDFVFFDAPNYTAFKPMGGDPIVSIDPNTGLITGTPTVQGQFVVGVCVSEYRNGQLLSKVFRDFQFNVANCDPTVIADVQEDFQISDQEFLINSCGDYTIEFNNQSFQEIYIDNYEWSFNMGGGQTTTVTDEWSPTLTFPGVGEYDGTLILNKGTDCGDTAYIYVNIYPEITADFSFAYDSCVAGAVTFTDLSTTGACCLTDWGWSFGDGQFSSQQHPVHSYQIPGDIPVTLEVRDTNNCIDILTQEIAYFPVPSLIVIAPSAETACQPATIFFDNLSFPIDTTYDIFWDFGEGGSSTEISPIYTYDTPGQYTVSVDITSPIGCQTDTVFNDLITILPSPIAGFTFSPEEPSNLFPEVQFTDQSTGAINWNWDFDTGQGSNMPSPLYTFPDTGMFAVTQIVTHPSGCMDTLIQIIDVIPEIRYYLPNAFTPNSDGTNDTFKGKGVFPGISNFQLAIWNRWGEIMFEADDPFATWNGKKHNIGQDAPPGVYLVVVTFLDPRKNPVALKSNVTLLR